VDRNRELFARDRPALRARHRAPLWFGTQNLLFATAPKPVDALWVAEEAAASGAFSAIVLVEIGGSPRDLDLTATRRLHRRALWPASRCFCCAQAGPSRADRRATRLNVAAAPSTLRTPVRSSCGFDRPAGRHVAIGKSRTAIPATVTLEWSHGAFQDRTTSDPALSRAVVALPAGGTDDAATLRQVVAFPGSTRRRRWSSAAAMATPSAWRRSTRGLRRLNLRIGLGVAEARAMHPGIEIIEEEPTPTGRMLRRWPTGATAIRRWWRLTATDGLFPRHHRLRSSVWRRARHAGRCAGEVLPAGI
jgi:hypothetical protein